MKARDLLLLIGLLVVSGCVTEDGGPAARDPSKASKSPVERVQGSINEQIDRMRFQYGNELLSSTQRLIAYKELSVVPILEALPQSDPRTRANLLYVLGFVGGTEAHQGVMAHLRDPEAGVRFEAAAALLQLGDWSAVPTLIDFMAADDRRLRYKSFQTLRDKTRLDFGYDFNAESTAREASMGRWRTWWQERRRELIYGKN